MREVSLAHIDKGVLYAEKIWARRVAPVERKAPEDFNQADVYRFMAKTEAVLQKQELLGGRDDAKKIAQQLAEGRAQAARENAARPAPAKGKEARDDR